MNDSSSNDGSSIVVVVGAMLLSLGGACAEIDALWPRLRATAEFILATGPWTPQERWEGEQRLLAVHDRRRDRRPCRGGGARSLTGGT